MGVSMSLIECSLKGCCTRNSSQYICTFHECDIGLRDDEIIWSGLEAPNNEKNNLLSANMNHIKEIIGIKKLLGME